MIHLYCGDGKGKSTAAAGLAVRMAGSGGKAVFARFLKSDGSGEVPVLNSVEGVDVLPCSRVFGFTWQMSESRKAEAAEYYTDEFRRACREAHLLAGQTSRAEGPSVLLVLDEICAAVNAGLVPETEVLEFLDGLPEGLEVVLTGRNPSGELMRRADYITEMKMIKHPYTEKVAARKGIEY